MRNEAGKPADDEAEESTTGDLALTDEQAAEVTGGSEVKYVDKSSPVIYNPPPPPPPSH